MRRDDRPDPLETIRRLREVEARQRRSRADFDRDQAERLKRDSYPLPTRVIRMDYLPDYPGKVCAIEEDPAKLLAIDSDRSLVSAVAIEHRPGAELFCVYLEFRKFRPMSAANLLYQFRAIVWQELFFRMVTIPAECRHLFDEAAAFSGLRVRDGVPATIEPDGQGGTVERFWPMQSQRTVNLENNTDSDLYRGGESGLLAWEQREVTKIRREHVAWCREQGIIRPDEPDPDFGA